MFKVEYCLLSSIEYFVVQLVEIFLALLEVNSLSSNEVDRGQHSIRQGLQICGFSDVSRE